MRRLSRSLAIGLLSIALLLPGSAALQPVPPQTPPPDTSDGTSESEPVTPGGDTCRAAVDKALAKEHRLFRSVVYGLRSASEAGVSEVRHDEEGNAWIKVKDDEWRTAAPGLESTTRSDDEMDQKTDTKPRQGIFETRRVDTSALIPHLTQSVRALQCRLAAVCGAVRESSENEGEDPVPVTVEIPGCIPIERETFPSCHQEPGGMSAHVAAYELVHCDDVMVSLLGREAALLKMAVEYDAAYRSLLQFAGNFDAFLSGLRASVTGTLRQVTGIVGVLQRIPCFLSSCDEYPPGREGEEEETPKGQRPGIQPLKSVTGAPQ
jgi:hypothetical protein